MRILVTGCNGQLGNEMQLLAKENGQHTYFFTDVVIPEGSVAQKLDITNEAEVEAFVEGHEIDCVVRLIRLWIRRRVMRSCVIC